MAKMAAKPDSMAEPRDRLACLVSSEWLTQQAIADLAFEFWLARGFQGGSPEEDLLRAEQEVRAGSTNPGKSRLFLVRKYGCTAGNKL